MIDEHSSSSIFRKRYLSPRRGSNPQPFDDRWDAVTIELPRLRWWAKVQVRYMIDLSGSHDMLMLWWDNILSLGSSMVAVSLRSSERYGLDPHLGLRNRFLRTELDEHPSIIKDISKLPHFENIYLCTDNHRCELWKTVGRVWKRELNSLYFPSTKIFTKLVRSSSTSGEQTVHFTTKGLLCLHISSANQT